MPAGRPSKYISPISYIYALCEPCGAVRYIGKADKLKKRIAEHKRSAKRGWTDKDRWIAALGDKLVVKVLKATGDWEADETALIAQHRGHCDLFNIADGGAGVYLSKPKGRGAYAKLIHGLMSCALQCERDGHTERAGMFGDMVASHKKQRKAALKHISPIQYDDWLSCRLEGVL